MYQSYKNFIYILIIASFMLFLAGYLSSFQSWLAFNYHYGEVIKSSKYSQFGGTGEIRQIIGSGTPSIRSSSEIDNAYEAKDMHSFQADHFIALSNKQSGSQQLNNDFNNQALDTQNDDAILKTDNLIQKNAPSINVLPDEILVNFDSDYSRREMQHALSRLMVIPKLADSIQLLEKTSINTRQLPYFYPLIENEFNHTVRYPAQAYRYAEYLLQNAAYSIEKNGKQYTEVSIPLKLFTRPNGMNDYQSLVAEFSQRYRVNSDLVYAIMDVESAFNPKAVSGSNALGLMQIKADSAGRDVYKYIDGKMGKPAESTLFNPKENIRIGVAYLALLKHRYFKDINNKEKKELLAIASYNGGLNTVFKLFGKTKEQAINRINTLSAKRVYAILNKKHESAETRQYIEKVMAKRQMYQKILQLKV